jgi:hypothetical protein
VHARVVRAFAQPGHWLGPVTGLGWLGLAQPMWAELGPAPKKIKIKKIESVDIKILHILENYIFFFPQFIHLYQDHE